MTRDHVGVSAGADAPRRLSLSQIVELLLTRGGGEHSSVTLKSNARGETQVEVTVRTGETDELATVDQAAAKARDVYDELRAAYPTAGDGSSPAGS